MNVLPSMTSPVAKLLAPRSIAIVGASDKEGSFGGRVIALLQKFNFPGEIWPVNPSRSTVMGLPCYARVKDLPTPPDSVIIAIPAEHSLDVVAECSEAGIHSGIMFAGGFAEAGAEGAERQRALARLCKERGFSLCGSNCLGVINTWMPMAATFSWALLEGASSQGNDLLQGGIAMVTQSGGLGASTRSMAEEAGFGFRYMVSTGNEAVLGTADFIAEFSSDPEIKVILSYLEGVHDGEKLLKAFATARRARKPIVMIKTGGTAESARAVASHTGALAGVDRVWSAVFREQAVIRATSQSELLDLGLYFSSEGSRIPEGKGVAVVVFGGGYGVTAADLCGREGLPTPPLRPETRAKLKELVPPVASTANPVDLTPQMSGQAAWRAKFPAALDAIASDPDVHTILFQLGAMGPPALEVITAILSFRARTAKPVVIAWQLATAEGIAAAKAAGVHVYPDPPRAVRTIARLVDYGVALRRAERPLPGPVSAFDWQARIPDAQPGRRP